MYKEVYYTIHCLYLQELEKGLNIQHQEMVKLISARKRQVYVDWGGEFTSMHFWIFQVSLENKFSKTILRL